MTTLIYFLALIGGLTALHAAILPLLEAVCYGVSYSLFVLQFRNKAECRRRPFAAAWHYAVLIPFKHFVGRLLGDESSVTSVEIKGKIWRPPSSKVEIFMSDLGRKFFAKREPAPPR